MGFYSKTKVSIQRIAHGSRYPLACGRYPSTGGKPLPQQHQRFPYVPVRDLKLKDRVSGKNEKEKSTSCIAEMAALFQCHAANDFNDAACVMEIDKLTKCNEAAKVQSILKKAKKEKDDYEAKRLNTKQLNNLLDKYPQKIHGIRRL